MFQKKNLFFILLISTFLIFSACSGSNEDCSSQDTTYKKYAWNDATKGCVLVNDIQANVCGNGVSEDGENYCNCPRDVLKEHPVNGCSGSLGDYLEKSCSSDDRCVLSQNTKVVSQIKSVEVKNSDVVLKADFTINTPLIQNTEDDNSIISEVEFFKEANPSFAIENLILKELVIENSAGIKFAEVSYNEKATGEGFNFGTKKFNLREVTKYNSKENLKAKFVISYTKNILDSQGNFVKVEEKIETLSVGLGTWDIINPNFFEE